MEDCATCACKFRFIGGFVEVEIQYASNSKVAVDIGWKGTQGPFPFTEKALFLKQLGSGCCRRF